ncbi:MAG: tight junction protein ZO-3 [Culturomica sp.]|nr:tight junction protein ZO-3 [Culturomica sp.]
MKRYIFLLLTALAILSGSCKQKNSHPNRACFTIPSEDRKIVVPVTLNDSVAVKFMFDTGGGFAIDSSVVIARPNLFSNDTGYRTEAGNSWGGARVPSLLFRKEQRLNIGTTTIKYPYASIYDLKRQMNSDFYDGMFDIPWDDSMHVWELNFESGYLEIHPADQFKMPENTTLFSLQKIDPNDRQMYVQLPFHIRCADGDTLTINRLFFIDTGATWDIVIGYPTEELTFFNQQEGAVWTSFLDRYTRYYTVNATLSDRFSMDSLRIYTFDYKDSAPQYLLGLNFLKRFNLFFDMKNKQVGFQPVNNFRRVSNPLPIRFYYSVLVLNGRYVINKMADYKENYYREAGLQEGDELVKVNGIPYGEVCHERYHADLSQEMKDQCRGQEFVVFDIIRDGKPLQIPVKINYNEQQGD